MRSLCRLSGILLLISASNVWSQTSLIDPSVLSQLSSEDKERLLSGMGSGSSSTSNQDQTLQNPQIIRSDSVNDDSYGGPDANNAYDYPLADGAGSRRGSQYDNRESTVRDASEGTFANPHKQGQGSGDNRGNNARSNLSRDPRPDARDSYDRDADDRFARSQRANGAIYKKPRPFGYELFSGVPNTFAPATDIPVPGDYVIGPGDNIRVQLFGNQNETFTLLVSRDGTVNFPKLGPISTNGLRFDELQTLLEGRVSKEMIGTTASVTLGRLRSMRVFVLGDVRRPGSYTVSSLSTMTHALFVSGGVSAVGSLRRVQLKRGGQVVQTMDLYRFLLGGDSSNDVRLQPGDVVFVPPVASRVTVEGEVKRPAIYELSGERSLADAIALAGGRLATSDQTSVEVERVTAAAERQVLNFDIAKAADLAAPIHDGDVVRVRKIARQISNEIRVTGYVKYPGSYPWSESRSLSSVLELAGVRESDIQAEVYLPLGAIERTNPQTGIRGFVSFNVANALNAVGEPIALQPNDVVIVFGREDIAYLTSRDVESALEGKPVAAAKTCEGLVELQRIVNSQRAVRFLRALSSESLRLQKASRSRVECPQIFEEVPRALPYLLDKSVGVYGEVVRPGVYPVADGTDFKLLMQAVAGPTSESDSRNVEYVSYQDALSNGKAKYQTLDLTQASTAEHAISAGDVFNFRALYLDQEIGSVRLIGEVRFPGTYSVMRGETMSQIIERAGGLTVNAYPYGSVFTRESARSAEEASYKRAANELQEAVVTVVTSGTLTGDVSSTATFLDGVIKRLQNAKAAGRVVVQADPAVLRLRPEQDVLMEAGDALLIPKRPSSVSVAGQVLNPGSQSFVAGNTAEDYIEHAGGIGQAADKKRAFIVFPNGEAKPLKLSAWNFQKQDVPPGSLIIVPRNAAPLNKLLLSERLLSIFSSLAISTAALVTIGNN
ncbi:SLBB domain-containing protein [Hydrocarboniphaga sp.]|uniref:SLBB domain-containing protein n=1 Tax=Hydrocarboniphaga sp. TaxID=2033016 RepID=UPI003D0F19AC